MPVLGMLLLAALTAAAGLPVAATAAATDPAAAQAVASTQDPLPQDSSGIDAATADEGKDDESQDGASAQGDRAQANSSVSLAASNITRTGATLTVTGHSTAWYYRRSPSTLGPCSSEVAANTAATLTDLTPATSYAFKAYSDSACSTELATADEFTTPGLVLEPLDTPAPEGDSVGYWVRLATQPTSDVTVTVAAATRASDRLGRLSVDTDSVASGNQSTLTFTTQNWDYVQNVSYLVAQDSFSHPLGNERDVLASITNVASSADTSYDGANATLALTIFDANAPTLSKSNVSATGATLTIHDWTDAWYYRTHARRQGECTEVPAGTSSVTLSSLAPGTEYVFDAYRSSYCGAKLTGRYRGIAFSTPGIMLSAAHAVVKEGSTATYTVRLATRPASSLMVSVARASGDGDLTFDTDPLTADDQSTLTFTTSNWSTPQTVTVTAASDVDSVNGTATFSHTATGLTATNLTATESDNVCSGTTAVGNAASGGLVDDCNTLLAAKAVLAGTSTALDNWATTLAIGSWTGITVLNNRVTDIELRDQGLQGVVPTTLSDLTSLVGLDLGGNQLTGPIPAQLGNLTNLKTLDLGFNQLTGPIPAQLGNLTNLEDLSLRGNALSGPIPAQLGNLTNLEDLLLDGNALSGPIPAQLGNLTNLEVLWLGDNALSGPIPAQLGNLTNLRSLLLPENALSGPIPAQLGNLAGLEDLSLGGNALSGPIPAQLGNLTNLRSLSLSNNVLSGPIPAQLGNLVRLTGLLLNDNALSGPIPPQLGRLANLEYLDLDDNALSGSIPTQLSELARLQWLNLSGNSLAGPIPAELAKLTDLRWLYLQRSTLSGPIPPELGGLTNLEELWLYANDLTGPIPAELGNLTDLGSIRLSSNWLSGCVPANLLSFSSESNRFSQRDGFNPAVCKGIVLSDAHPTVEEGSTATYTVRLSTAPTQDVTVNLALVGDSSITANPATLTFTASTWDTAQTVTLTAAQDTDAATGTTTITHTATSTDSDYSALTATAVATEDDDDPSLAAREVTATSARIAIANHTTAWYFKQTVPSETPCSPEAQAGTDGVYLVSLKPGARYAYKAYSDASCTTELTSDSSDAEFTTASGVQTSTQVVVVPEGSTGSFTVNLASEPAASVTVTVSGAAGGDSDLGFDTDSAAAGDQDTLKFSTTNWSTPKTVTVTAAQDADTAHGELRLTLTPTSTDSDYNGSAPAILAAVESDDDAVLSASAVTPTSAVLTLANRSGDWYLGTGSSCAALSDAHTVLRSGLSPATAYRFKAYSDSRCATELTSDATDAGFTTASFAVLSTQEVAVTEGGSAAYTVRLAAAPTSDVTVTAAAVTNASSRFTGLSVDTDALTAGNQSTLTFTATDWQVPQMVTVGVSADGFYNPYGAALDALATVTHTAASSDTSFSGATAHAALRVTDSGAPSLAASAVSATGATLTISGWTGKWYYQRHPKAAGTCTAVAANTATVTLSSLAPGAGYAFKAYSDQHCHAELTSDRRDAEFTTPGIVLSAARLVVPEGGSAAYSARLATRPAGGVTVTIAPSANGDSDLTVDTDPGTDGNQSTLGFNALNWSTPQTVIVSAANETAVDKVHGVNVFSHTAAGYTTAEATRLLAAEGDDDVCASTAAVGNATSGGLVDDCNTLLAAKPVLAGNLTSLANWATDTHISSWTGITVSDGRVTGIDLYNQSLQGSVPNTLADLAALETLSLFRNELSGPIPTQLGSLANLETLWLSGNKLSGPIPAELGSLASLESLTLSGNALTGPIPAQLGSLTALEQLGLSQNMLSGPIPAPLGSLAKLKRLHLNDNELSGAIPSQLGNLTALGRLWLHGNALTGPIPTQLGDPSALTMLWLQANALSGAIPAQLGSLSHLSSLYLNANALSGAIPAELGSLSGLTWLNLSFNTLSGAIPTGLGSLTKLELLHLNENKLTGTIPLQIGNLTRLEDLWLNDNALTGSIPSGLGNLAKLTSLHLNINALTGTIPARLGSLNELAVLGLNGNDLSGTIPRELGNLTELKSFQLHDNELSGSIPTEIGNLTDVLPGSFDVSRNDLTGCVPPNLDKYLSDLDHPGRFTQTDGTVLAVCAGLVISDAHPTVPEGGTVTYTVHLASPPTGDVTVNLALGGGANASAEKTATTDSVGAETTADTARAAASDTDITVSPSTLTFTSLNYDQTQTVTVTGGQDDDATNGINTINHTTASTDPSYHNLSAPVRVSESDDDTGLFASDVTQATATLTITNHTAAWHYKRTAPAGGACSDEIPARTAATALSGLRAGTRYVFAAYSDENCSSKVSVTDAAFTTQSAPTTGPGGSTPGGGGGSGRAASIRLSGADRYATAAAVGDKFVTLVEDASAAAGTRRQVDAVIVASGEAFPDALAASALARTLRAPVVLTPKKQLDPAVKSFVTRNRITKVVIVGGPAAVSDDVADTLRGLPGIETVTRRAGPDRYSTAALIAQAAGTPGNLCGSTTPTVIVTTGQNFPDALVAGPLAYRGRHPIVLTASDRLPEATAEYLRTSGAKQAVIVGGPAAVSSSVIDAIKALGLETSRVSGADRADTSVQFARRYSTFSGPSCYRRDTVGLATGFAFPDALSAAALLGHYGAPLLLTSPSGVPQPLIDYAASGRLEPDFDQPPIVTIGGRNAVPADQPTKLLAALPR